MDVWSCGGSYTDLASIGQLAKHTTGDVNHYPGFSDQISGEKLSRDLQRSLTRDQGWEAVMRVRVSRGLRISAFHGHFFIRGTDLLALPNVDEDKTFAVEIGHEENALSAPTCCLQAALLYTTSSGERRIRVHTMELPVTSTLATLYEQARPLQTSRQDRDRRYTSSKRCRRSTSRRVCPLRDFTVVISLSLAMSSL